jgi:hypothetical protein
MPQQAQVIDAVRPADHPRHHAGHLHLRVHPAPAADPHMLTSQRRKARPLRQRHHRHQPRPRHQIRVIKRRVDLR